MPRRIHFSLGRNTTGAKRRCCSINYESSKEKQKSRSQVVSHMKSVKVLKLSPKNKTQPYSYIINHGWYF